MQVSTPVYILSTGPRRLFSLRDGKNTVVPIFYHLGLAETFRRYYRKQSNPTLSVLGDPQDVIAVLEAARAIEPSLRVIINPSPPHENNPQEYFRTQCLIDGFQRLLNSHRRQKASTRRSRKNRRSQPED